MLTAIDLHNQLAFKAHEIDDVRTEGLLMAEPMPTKLSIGRMTPEPLLRVRRAPPKLLGAYRHAHAMRVPWGSGKPGPPSPGGRELEGEGHAS